ncbi:unnamed protein product [Effrenium voratum]|nr:unnamed protein product [Effrenium voratum]
MSGVLAQVCSRERPASAGIEAPDQELRLRQAMTEFSSNLPTIWAAAHQGPPSSHKLDYPRRQAECAASQSGKVIAGN